MKLIVFSLFICVIAAMFVTNSAVEIHDSEHDHKDFYLVRSKRGPCITDADCTYPATCVNHYCQTRLPELPQCPYKDSVGQSGYSRLRKPKQKCKCRGSGQIVTCNKCKKCK